MGTILWVDMPHVEIWYGDPHTMEEIDKLRADISKEIMTSVVDAVDMYELPKNVRVSIV